MASHMRGSNPMDAKMRLRRRKQNGRKYAK
jgi:hypothetical protein